jgi:hypothetical protein
MTESPEEKAALEKLDEETEQVAWSEFQKEADRELSTSVFSPRLSRFGWRRAGGMPGWMFGRFRPFRWKKGDPVPEPVDDPDPGDEHGLRDALREGEREYEAKHPGERT